MEISFIIVLSEYYCNNCFTHILFFINIKIILIENWQDIDPMGLSAYFSD